MIQTIIFCSKVVKKRRTKNSNRELIVCTWSPVLTRFEESFRWLSLLAIDCTFLLVHAKSASQMRMQLVAQSYKTRREIHYATRWRALDRKFPQDLNLCLQYLHAGAIFPRSSIFNSMSLNWKEISDKSLECANIKCSMRKRKGWNLKLWMRNNQRLIAFFGLTAKSHLPRLLRMIYIFQSLRYLIARPAILIL